VVFAVLLLLVPATGLSQLKLGVSYIGALPEDSEPRRAAAAAGEGFTPGIVSPTEILLEAPGIGDRREALVRLEQQIADQPGVAGVVGPREQVPRPLPRYTVSETGAAARYAVVFEDDPLGSDAIDRLGAIEQRMPVLLRDAGLDPQTRVRYGGETALADETIDLMLDDLGRIALVVLAVNLVLLVLFMRALVAPLYLLAAGVLGLAATLGLTVYFARYVLGSDELTYYVPFAASVLLVSLGSDYNVFVAGRIWAEARQRRLREAIAVATPAAARAVRVAGIALAASFALLAIVPLRSFREFAFVIGAGILIDTFVVRPLLIPGLIAAFGELSWRPGRRISALSRAEFIERLVNRTGLSPAHAARAAEAVLATLGERITRRERRVLALYLPKELGGAVREARGGADRFPLDEFVRRVADRERLSEESAREDIEAVMSTLAEAVAAGEMDYVRNQLSEDYDAVMPGAATQEQPSPRPAVHA
jgi:putative drug exporter of the RND superfamily